VFAQLSEPQGCPPAWKSYVVLTMQMGLVFVSFLAKKKHAEFLKARGRHYSREGEAMKRARELMGKDDDVEGGNGEGGNGESMEQDGGEFALEEEESVNGI
jgi:hypothetical protein